MDRVTAGSCMIMALYSESRMVSHPLIMDTAQTAHSVTFRGYTDRIYTVTTSDDVIHRDEEDSILEAFACSQIKKKTLKLLLIGRSLPN